jgi:DNA invertase Pin-like site-specific DNA recombinase
MQMVGAFAEFERAILRERTKAGLDAARKQGRIGGRRPKLRPNQQDEIVTMVSMGTKTAADAARLSMFIQRRSRGFWLKPVPGLSG